MIVGRHGAGGDSFKKSLDVKSDIFVKMIHQQVVEQVWKVAANNNRASIQIPTDLLV